MNPSSVSSVLDLTFVSVHLKFLSAMEFTIPWQLLLCNSHSINPTPLLPFRYCHSATPTPLWESLHADNSIPETPATLAPQLSPRNYHPATHTLQRVPPQRLSRKAYPPIPTPQLPFRNSHSASGISLLSFRDFKCATNASIVDPHYLKIFFSQSYFVDKLSTSTWIYHP